MSSSRIWALIIVALIHALLGYAFVTGLAFKYVKEVSEKLNTFDVEEPPPPPEEVPPPPPPPDQPMQPPPVVTPPALVSVPSMAPTIQSVPTPPPVYIPAPVAAPPAPPAPPPPPVVNKAAGPKGNPADWVSQDDYPPSSIRAEEQGTSGIAWTINAAGRVENCRVTSSSGSAALDRAACAAITRRGRYSPALDQAGNPIPTQQSRRVVWRLPTE